MAGVTILNLKHQLREPEALLNACFPFLPSIWVMELTVYHFWRNYRAGERAVCPIQSHSMQWPCWGSTGKFHLQGGFLGTVFLPLTTFSLLFSGCSNTNLHRTKTHFVG